MEIVQLLQMRPQISCVSSHTKVTNNALVWNTGVTPNFCHNCRLSEIIRHHIFLTELTSTSILNTTKEASAWNQASYVISSQNLFMLNLNKLHQDEYFFFKQHNALWNWKVKSLYCFLFSQSVLLYTEMFNIVWGNNQNHCSDLH